jgi:hypothetical protein
VILVLVGCGGGGTSLSDDECARWANLWVYGPGVVAPDSPRDFQRDLLDRMDRMCRAGKVSRAEYNCAIAAKDEPSFAACGDPDVFTPPACESMMRLYLGGDAGLRFNDGDLRAGLIDQVRAGCATGETDRDEILCLLDSQSHADDDACLQAAAARHAARDR